MTVVLTKVGRTFKPKTIVGELIQDGLSHITIVVYDSKGVSSIKRYSKKNLKITYLS